MYIKRTILSFFFVLLLSFASIGQETAGTIEGIVKDPNGAVVPGATVTIESSGSTTGFSRTLVTNGDGYFIVPRLSPGTYKVSFSAEGFKSSARDVRVVLGGTASANQRLELGSVGGVVDVVAGETIAIDPGDTKINTNITKQTIDALPKGTTFSSLLKTAPNVRPEALNAGFQIDGASGAENVFVIDGQEVTNFRTGQLNSNNNVPFELVQEVQIKSTGFEAEYGGATGGVINVATVGGNDGWHGNLGISFEPSKLQGDPNPILHRWGSGTGQFEQFQPTKDGGTNLFPTASLNGPIVKGKLWFSAVYAPQFSNIDRTINYYNSDIPASRSITETIGYRRERRTEQAFFRLDAQPTSKIRIFGTFLWNPIIDQGAIPGADEGLSGSPQGANFGGSTGFLRGSEFLGQQGGRQNSNSVNGQVTWNPTNNLVLNFRGGRNFLNEKLGSYGIPNSTRVLCSATSRFDLLPAGDYGCTTGEQNFASNYQTAFDSSTRTTFDADAGFFGINALGRHNFKFGYQYNRLSNETEQGYANLGSIVLYYGRKIDDILGTPPSADAIGSGLITRFGTIGSASSDNQSLFVQDSWQIGKRLTINLGIRVEKELVPTFGDAATTKAIEFGWGAKPAPRVGVAFDLTGDGKTKLFGSFGWFYDRFKYELPRGSFGGDFFRRDYFEIRTSRGTNKSNYTLSSILGSTPDILGGNCPDSPGVYPPLGNGFSICQFDFRIATNIEGADVFQNGGVDPDIKAARQSEYTFGVERELARNFLLSARYTHKQVDRAVEDIGVINDQGSEAYVIGNPGLGLACEISTLGNQPCVKANRDYDAFEVRIDKRAAKYFFNANYTLSRLFGNYSGLASSDEFGRSSPNVNRFFDLPFLGYSSTGTPDDGRLATDRPHVFKAFGGYTFDWAGDGVNTTSISAFTTIQSGTPLTTIFTLLNVSSAILNERGDLGRTETFTETDLSISHNYKFGSDNRFTFQPFVNFRNLFDERNELTRSTTISTVNFSTGQLKTGGCTTCTTRAAIFDKIINGGGIQDFVNNYINANPAARATNTYKSPNGYQSGREVRFGFRFIF